MIKTTLSSAAKIIRKTGVFSLCIILLFTTLSACGQNNDTSGNNTSLGQTVNPNNGEQTTGRYVEYDITPEGMQGYPESFTSFGNGELAFIEVDNNGAQDGFVANPYTLWRSTDGGATWQSSKLDWVQNYRFNYSEYTDSGELPPQEVFLTQLYPLQNGGVAAILNNITHNAETGALSNTAQLITVSAEGVENLYPLQMDGGTETGEADCFIFNTMAIKGGRLLYVVDNYLTQDADGAVNSTAPRTYVCNLNTGETLYELQIEYHDNVLSSNSIVYTSDYQNYLRAYNINDGTPSNVPLPDMAAQNQINNIGLGNMFVDDTGVFYYADGKGMYEYRQGGANAAPPASNADIASQGRQIMEGTYYTFGMPGYTADSIEVDSDSGEIFMAVSEVSTSLAKSGKVLRYVWDDTAQIVSQDVIRVFSLYESASVHLAMAEFIRQNPDVKVQYENIYSFEDISSGFASETSGGNIARASTSDRAQTIEDAIRALNTELLAGTGPDVLILDGLPIENFVERDVLQDLSDIIDTNENLLPQIIEPMRTGDAIYTVPTNFMLPVLFGVSQELEQYTSLDALVQSIQSGPSLPPEFEGMFESFVPVSEQPTIEFVNLEGIFDAFYVSNAPAIFNGENGIDAGALETFLQSIKAVSDKYGVINSTNGGFTATQNIGNVNFHMSDTLSMFSFHRARAGYHMLNSAKILTIVSEYLTVSTMQTTQEAETDTERGEYEDVAASFISMPGLASGVYMPTQMVGVTTTSTQPQHARAFVNAMLSENVQNEDLGAGFPVMRSSLERAAKLYENTPPLVEEQHKVLFNYEAMINALSTPYFANTYLQSMILTSLYDYCADVISLDEAVNQVVEGTRLYFAERQ